MLSEYLEKQEDCVLWALLADIGGLLSERTQPTQTDNFWISIAGEITREVDKRLANEYDADVESGN